MLEQDVRYLKFKTFLSFYCPHCKKTFNIERRMSDPFSSQPGTIKMNSS